jgi:hypothetical protein
VVVVCPVGSIRPLLVPVRWHVRAAGLPAAIRHCARCDRRSRFASTGLFRVNASGRKLDVWLVYRCVRCQLTWNRTVEERRTVADVGARLPRYERNDEALAREIACDVAGLARHGPVETGGVRVERDPLVTRPPLAISFAVDPGCLVRLDRLLAAELGVSRERMRAWAAQSRLIVEPVGATALRRPVADGMRVSIHR